MTIFVGGVHGVGKTYVAKPASERIGFRYASASQLIREERGRASWGDEKVVSEVEPNQQALISATRRLQAAGVPLVLDGHFVLRVAPGKHAPIPVDVFGELDCVAVVLLHCPTALLASRMQGRGDHSWTDDELTVFSEAEFEHGSKVAAALRIPFVPLEAPSREEFEVCLQGLRRNRDASRADLTRG